MLVNHVPDNKIKYFRRRTITWGKKNFADFPWRHATNQWHALVAELMLQRTKAEQVLPEYLSFCNTYQSPQEYIASSAPSPFISLGLHWRSETFKKLAEVLAHRELPLDKSQLLQLPGIGDYIASAFLSLHVGIREPIIDSNIVRLYGRFFGFATDGETRRKRWFIELAERLTPARNFKDFNYAVIDLTRTICKPKPLCSKCLLKRKCSHL